MPARFRLFERKGGIGDRYTLIDAKDQVYISFNSQPWHPTYGIGITSDISARTWAEWGRTLFRSLGTRMGLEDLKDKPLKKWLVSIIREWGGKPENLLRGRNSLRARAKRLGLPLE